MMMSWIVNNAIVGNNNGIVGKESDVMDLKKALMKIFKCNNCGPMDEYDGCTIEKLETGGIKFWQ